MIDKGLNPIRKGIIKDPTFSVYKKGGSVDKPEQLELPLDNPNDNILNFPIKPNMPIYNWFKSEVKKGKKFASKGMGCKTFHLAKILFAKTNRKDERGRSIAKDK